MQVCHVEISARWAVDHHAVQHLREQTMAYEGRREWSMMSFWMPRLVKSTNAQVTTGHHMTASYCGEDAVDVVHTPAVLDFGNDADVESHYPVGCGYCTHPVRCAQRKQR